MKYFLSMIFIMLITLFTYSQTGCSITEPQYTNCEKLAELSDYTPLPNTHIQMTLDNNSVKNYYLTGDANITIGYLNINDSVKWTLLLCNGKFKFTTDAIKNNWIIIVSSNAKLELYNNNNEIKIEGKIFNYGVLNVNGSKLHLNGNGVLFNNFNSIVVAPDISNDGKIINNGIIQSNNSFKINGSGKICAGSGSIIETNSLTNDSNNAIEAVEGYNCFSFITTVNGNGSLSDSPNTLFCGRNNTTPTQHQIGKATFNSGCTSCAVPLGSTLLSFEGYNANGFNHLEFVTSRETNIDYYSIEHSDNGYDWKEVDRLSPQHLNENVYKSIHKPSIVDNYYRLITYDYDHTKTISDPIYVRSTLLDIVNRYNLFGQLVDEYYKGIVILEYSNGTIEKIYK